MWELSKAFLKSNLITRTKGIEEADDAMIEGSGLVSVRKLCGIKFITKTLRNVFAISEPFEELGYNWELRDRAIVTSFGWMRTLGYQRNGV